MLLTFQSVEEIPFRDHANETSSALLLPWYHLFYNILQKKINEILVCFLNILIFGTFGSYGVNLMLY